VNESVWLAERSEEHRSRLRAIAYRMLGSLSEADDAIQELWRGSVVLAEGALTFSWLAPSANPALVHGAAGLVAAP
jgi:Sigma-70 region 2